MVSHGVTVTQNWFVRQKALLLEVCLQSRLRACTSSRVHCQRQLVQRRTTVAEVIVWQQLNARQLYCISKADFTITDNIILPWHANYLNHHRLPGLITFSSLNTSMASSNTSLILFHCKLCCYVMWVTDRFNDLEHCWVWQTKQVFTSQVLRKDLDKVVFTSHPLQRLQDVLCNICNRVQQLRVITTSNTHTDISHQRFFTYTGW